MSYSTGAQLQAAIDALPAAKKGSFVAFDAFYYGNTYMGAYAGSLSPIDHFAQIGAARGYKPNATFDPVYYTGKYPDVAGKGFDAADLLVHFLKFGLDEGRAPNATFSSFDGAAYLAANPDVATFVNANLAQFGGSTSNGAIAHFVKFGSFEGRSTGAAVSSASQGLTTNVDALNGTTANDTFVANFANNGNTFQSGDTLNGGAGSADKLMAELGSSSAFAIRANTTGVEQVFITSQSTNGTGSSGNNNVDTTGQKVTIDAEKMVGVTQWWNTDSRADLKIEDIRILDTQITKDITIGLRNTDAGSMFVNNKVDYEVYFSPESLRDKTGVIQANLLTLEIMDVKGQNLQAQPLAILPLVGFTAKVVDATTNVRTDYTFGGDGTATGSAIDAATTYEGLVAALNAAVAASNAPAGLFTFAVGNNFTATSSATGESYSGVGKQITLTMNNAAQPSLGFLTSSDVFGATISSSTYIFQQNAPSNEFRANKQFVGQPSTVNDLITSTIILDNVGREDEAGSLTIGSMSTHGGVERFNITVENNADNAYVGTQSGSWLSKMSSTNNTLQEVIVVNAADGIANPDYLYLGTNVDQAGNNLTNMQDWPGGLDRVYDPITAVTTSLLNTDGLTDVRLFNASAMPGNVFVGASITGNTIRKYQNLVDTAQAHGADDVAFQYLTGAGNDSINLAIDGGVAASNSNIVVGRHDFKFTVDGGAGNDNIAVRIIDGLVGGAQAWYNNQKLNANVVVNGGEGNDTIQTPGAGDVIIDGGSGNDAIYTDNTGVQNANALAVGFAGPAALAYTNAAAAELAAAQAARVLDNTIGPVATDGTAAGTAVTPASVVAGLQAIDALTPTNPPALPAITHAALAAETANQAALGNITLAQKIALDAAYNSATGGVITPAAGISAPATLVGHVVVGGNVTAAELAAGDALLATYVTAAKAAQTADDAALANVAAQNALLNVTQGNVVDTYMAINGVEDLTTGAVEIGTANVVSALATLQAALVNGASQAAAVAAIDAASAKGLFGAAVLGGTTAANVLTAVGAGAMDAADAAAVVALLSPIANAAAIANTTAQAAYTAALAADVTAVNTAAAAAAANAVTAPGAVVANDFVGSTEAAAAAAAAATARNQANVDVAASQAITTALNDLKAAVNVGTLDAGITIAFQNANAAIAAAIASSAATGTGAVAVNPLVAAQAALLVLVGSPGNAVDAAEELAFDTGALGVFDANAVNSLIIANTVQTNLLTAVAADLTATATATATASAIAAAAAASGGLALAVAAPMGVYVLNTSNQLATYNRVTMDDRNLADLKSDVSNSYNLYQSKLTVSFKGLTATVDVGSTAFKTSDLHVNQAIKAAINNDAVLSKLLLATDGPGNTLVVTSLVDGVRSIAELSVALTAPTTVSASDVAAAAAAYGVAATEAAVLAAMATAKAAFDTKADYVDQLAETGAAGGNTLITGAVSSSSSDNTITGGTGNDVIVLGTTVGIDGMTSSNEKVVYTAAFGNDTIVNFAATGLGIDTLDFTALKGSGAVAFGSLALDKSIVVAAETVANDTAAEVAALFTDSATAINHVYVAYNANNVGNVYTVADAAGAGGVTATLVGTIDLADTPWANLTAANFA